MVSVYYKIVKGTEFIGKSSFKWIFKLLHYIGRTEGMNWRKEVIIDEVN